MIRTKLAKKVLSKKHQKHLTEMGISSMKMFNEVRKTQLTFKETHSTYEPCWDCRMIASKLGVS